MSDKINCQACGKVQVSATDCNCCISICKACFEQVKLETTGSAIAGSEYNVVSIVNDEIQKSVDKIKNASLPAKEEIIIDSLAPAPSIKSETPPEFQEVWLDRSYIAKFKGKSFNNCPKVKIPSKCPKTGEPILFQKVGGPHANAVFALNSCSCCKSLYSIGEIVQEVIPASYQECWLNTGHKKYVPTCCPNCNQKLELNTSNGMEAGPNNPHVGIKNGDCKCKHTINSLQDTYYLPTVSVFIPANIADPSFKGKRNFNIKINVPSYCPKCNQSISCSSRGDKDYPATLSHTNCEHVQNYEDLVKLASSSQKIPSFSSPQDMGNYIHELISPHAYLYGKFLRDEIDGRVSKEINFFAPSFDNEFTKVTYPNEKLVELLTAQGFTLVNLSNNNKKNPEIGYNISTNTYSVTSPDNAVTLQVSISKTNVTSSYDKVHDHAFVLGTDVSINSLIKRKPKSAVTSHFWTYSQIYDHIKRKVYETVSKTLETQELKNLEAEGFRLETKPLETEVLNVNGKNFYVKKGEAKNLALEIANIKENKVPIVIGNKAYSIAESNFSSINSAISDAITASTLQAAELAKAKIVEDQTTLTFEGKEFKVSKDQAEQLQSFVHNLIKTKKKTMNKSELLTGDRVLLNIKDDDSIEYEVPATVLVNENGNVAYLLDDFFESECGAWASMIAGDLSNDFFNQIEELGLDPDLSNYWDDYTDNTEVLKKIPHNSFKSNVQQNSQDKEKKAKGTKKMAYDNDGDEMSFFDMIKAEAAEAGLEIVATQLTTGLQQGVLAMLKSEGGFSDEETNVVKKILASKGGHAILSWALGMVIDKVNIPGVTDIAGVQDLGKKFRVGGMREIGNEGADIAMKYFMPSISKAMDELPKLQDKVALMTKKKAAPSAPSVEVGEVEVDLEEIAAHTENQAAAGR